MNMHASRFSPASAPSDDVRRSSAGILHGYAAIGAYLGLTSDAARNRAARESIPIVRTGRRVWITQASLDRWIASQEAAAAARAEG